ncbi:MAG: enoyl-CoA hydratase/isomerase family protein [Rhizobiales bacterium]|nr:enoyl-CoA hydratase/isomerase family protein [Hyphomicrobiales bacterium]
MNDFVGYESRNGVGIITINNPPVNALGQGVRAGLVSCLEAGLADDSVNSLVLIGGGRTFPAGADITEFGKPLKAPDLRAVIVAYENSSKLVVAAIHGHALGGGLEIAFGCDYRIGDAKCNVGLPEVTLGILPGAGGTQRLPRLIDPSAALDLILSGAFVAAPKALKLGILDKVAETDLLEAAIEYAGELISSGAPRRRIRDMEINADAKIFDEARATAKKRARGFEAPLKCIQAVENAATMSFDDGLREERVLFEELVSSDQSKGQRYMFFAEREVAKIPDIPRDTPLRDISSVGIIGAGTMGGGIAMNFANAGIPVVFVETTQEALDRGLGIIKDNYAATVSRGRLTQDAMDSRMALFSGSLDFSALSDVDMVIEAVFENMALKKEIFQKLDKVCKPGAILATNTSTLDIDEIAAETGRPEDVIGMHFFSPANVMRLLEIVRAEKTGKDIVATVMKLSKKIRKVSAVVGVCDGFVGNRMLHGYMDQAMSLLEEGALPQQIDKALFDWGWAMGPFAVMDLAGNDVSWLIRQEQAPDRDRNLPYPHTIADQLCEQGRFGQKASKGWYLYSEGSRKPEIDPDVDALVLKVSAGKGITRRDISDQEIVQRCMYALANVGADLLDEGIALRAGDIDVIYNAGYGFPRYRGGPMLYADMVGLDNMLASINQFREDFGPLWRPSKYLEKLVAEGKTFSGT